MWTGKPYKWNFTGALPSSLRFNASSGKILGVVMSTAPVGTYPLSICVTGGKKGATSKIRNTICKSTSLSVVQGASSTPAVNSATGTYAGDINFPNLNPTGSTNNKMMPTLTGVRVGNTITVTLQSRWGARGPYTWQCTGNSISGVLPAYCWDLSTYALLNEGSYTFNLMRG